MARLSTQQIAAGLRQAGFSEDIIPTMTAVTMAESGGNARAHNPNRQTGDNSYGLLQVNMIDGMGPERRQQFGIDTDDQLFDPLTNFKAAKQIYDQQGIGAWGAFTNGSYKQYLGSDTSGGAQLPAGLPAPSSDKSGLGGAGSIGDYFKDDGAAGRSANLSAEQKTALSGLSVDMGKQLTGGDGRMAGGAMPGIFSTVASNSKPTDRMAGSPAAQSSYKAPQGGGSSFTTGNTGASTGPHLDFRVYSKSKGDYVSNPGDYTHLVTTAEGKPVNQAFDMTSPYGMRTHPTKGGQKLHEGIDYATPSGTQLQVAGSFVERKSEPGGGGNYNIYQHPTNPDLELVLMHGA